MRIFGAGLAGCIAAHVFPEATIYEAAKEPVQNHHALLRFKTDAISKVVGIPFKKVDIQKMIWFEGKEVPPSARMNSMYSMKVAGKYLHRSISKMSNDVRYIAPNDFHMQLQNRLKKRIEYGHKITTDFFHDMDCSVPSISTLPIGLMKNIANNTQIVKLSDDNRKIHVINSDIKNCDMYLTCYYPCASSSVYRASITGSKLIIESMSEINTSMYLEVLTSLGINFGDIDNEKNFMQPNGKLTEATDGSNKKFIHNLTVNHNVYSLGRFALHRNILLDDVLEDCYVIRRMISQDTYSQQLERSNMQ